MNKLKFVKQTAGLFGSAVCEGQTKRGTDLAPRALREGGLLSALYNLKWTITDLGDISRKDVTIRNNPKKETFRNSLVVGELNRLIYQRAKEIAQANSFMVNIGGDHGVATGSIAGLLEVYGKDLRVVWVDAHADINFNMEPTRNYHGMPVAHLMGLIPDAVPGFEWLQQILSPEQIIYIAIRDVDPDERQILKEKRIKYFSMDEIIELGIGGVMQQTIQHFDGKPIHVSFDVDSIDPDYAHGTGTLVDGGITYREAHYILRKLYSTGQTVGLDLVEINPILESSPENREQFFGDFQQIGKIEGTQTVALGIELIASALGRTLV